MNAPLVLTEIPSPSSCLIPEKNWQISVFPTIGSPKTVAKINGSPFVILSVWEMKIKEDQYFKIN